MTFTTYFAKADTWAALAKQTADAMGSDFDAENSLGILYVSDTMAQDLASILTYLKQKTTITHWIGGVAVGLFSGRINAIDDPAAAVMVCPLGADMFRTFTSISDVPATLSVELKEWAHKTPATFGLVHGDPYHDDLPNLINSVAEISGAFLTGGLVSSREVFHQIADRITGGGVSGALFAPEVTVMTGLTQGCTPIGARHMVDEVKDDVVVSLDGRPSLDVLLEDLGHTKDGQAMREDLSQMGGLIHAAIPLEGSDTGDFMVRALTGIDPMHKMISVGEPVLAGSQLMFVRRDAASARVDMADMLEKMRQRLDTLKIRGGVYISCMGRGPGLFGSGPTEQELIYEGLGEFPMIGYYAGGEISGGRLYGYTGVLVLFTEEAES